MEAYLNLCAWAVLVAGGVIVVCLVWYLAILLIQSQWDKSKNMLAVREALFFHKQYSGQLHKGKIINAPEVSDGQNK